jgi:arabinose-5-phosphate isomerase
VTLTVRAKRPKDERTAAILAAGREVLAEAAGCLTGAAARLGGDFVATARALAEPKSFTMVMGVGKSGHIGAKFAASLVSTGHGAVFVHPVEALHGDLGFAAHTTLAVLLSHRGAADELLAIAPRLKGFGIPVALVTRARACPLAAYADWVIETGVDQEAGPHGLAPTSSTTTTLSLCDALMVASLAVRGFTPEDFRRFHPGGALGRHLNRVERFMTPLADTPWLKPDTGIDAVLEAITQGGRGFVVVSRKRRGPGVKAAEVGVISDGDVRRAARDRKRFAALTAGAMAKMGPKTIAVDAFAVDALRLMEQHRITFLMCADARGNLDGSVHIHDLVTHDVMPGQAASGGGA